MKAALNLNRGWARLVAGGMALAFALGLTACGGGSGAETNIPSATKLAAADTVATASVVAVTKISETRVSRTVYDYVFKVTVQNGAVPQTAVLATLTKVGAGTSIIDGSVLAGDLDASASVTPTDTITLRHDRTFTFDLAALTWQVTGTPVIDPIKEGAQLAGGLSGSALVGQPYSAQVNAYANDKRNSITGMALANATVGGAPASIDPSGVLLWTPNDADFANTKSLLLTVNLSVGDPVQFDVAVRVTKERLIHSAAIPPVTGTITDPYGRYLIKVEPRVPNAPMTGILTINEIYESTGRFVYAIRVPVSSGAQVTVLESPNLFGTAETAPLLTASILARKQASTARLAAATPAPTLKSDIGIYLDSSLSGEGQQAIDRVKNPLLKDTLVGVNVFTTRTTNIDRTTATFIAGSENSTPQIAQDETKAWIKTDHVFQIDANCKTTDECSSIVSSDSTDGLNVSRSPVILIHGFNVAEQVGGGEETWGALAQTLTSRGHPVFELRWNTYMRFEEAAGLLAKLGVRVATVTGKKVHVIAHSFGGIVAHQALMGKGITYSGSKWEAVDPKDSFQRMITLGAPLSGISLQPSPSLNMTAGRDISDGDISHCKAVTCFQAGADTDKIAEITDDLRTKISRIDPEQYTFSLFKNGDSIRNLQKAWQDGTGHKVIFTTVSDLKLRPKEYLDADFQGRIYPSPLTNQTAFRLGDGLISLMGHAVVSSDFSSTPTAPLDQLNILASRLGPDFLTRLNTKFADNMDRREVASQVSTEKREYYFAVRAAHSCAQLGGTLVGGIKCGLKITGSITNYLIANYPSDGIVAGIAGENVSHHPLYSFIYGNAFSTYLAEPPVSFGGALPNVAAKARGTVTRSGIAVTTLPSGSTFTIERKSTGVRVTDNLPVSPGTTTGSFTIDVGAALRNALPNQSIVLSDYKVSLKISSDSPYANFPAGKDVIADIDFGTIDITPTLASGYVSAGGIVTNQNSLFVAGAQVTLLKGENRSREQMLAILANSPSAIARSMTTGAQGQYSAIGLEPGIYTALILKSGYNESYLGRVFIGPQGDLGLNFSITSPIVSQTFRDDFNGTALQTSYWTTYGAGAVSVANGSMNTSCRSYASTQNKVTFSGTKIVIEGRMGGLGSLRDVNFFLIDSNNGEQIAAGDTNYLGKGLYAYGSGAFALPQSGNGISIAGMQEFRLTLEGTSLKLERGSSLSGSLQTITQTLGSTVAGRTFFLILGTGGADYCPGSYDWVQITATTVTAQPAPPANYPTTCKGQSTVLGGWTRFGTASYDPATNTYSVGDTLVNDPNDVDGDCNAPHSWAPTGTANQDNDWMAYNKAATGNIDFSAEACITHSPLSGHSIGLYVADPAFTGVARSGHNPFTDSMVTFNTQWTLPGKLYYTLGTASGAIIIPNAVQSAKGFCGTYRMTRSGNVYSAYFNGTLLGSIVGSTAPIVPMVIAYDNVIEMKPTVLFPN